MGTKNNPSVFDCYTKAEPDEPTFTLIGRDPNAGFVVGMWAARRMLAIKKGERPPEDLAMVDEAFDIAEQMKEFHEKWKARKASQ